MGTRITGGGVETVYAAAEKWVERALRADDSLFTPGEAIWSSRWLGKLHERFLNHPDESSDSFLEKLQQQLADSSPEVYQLMGEVLYFYFLIVTTKNSANQQRVIDTVLEWSPSPIAIPPDLVAGLTPGITNPGPYFHTGRPFQVGFLIAFVEQWKEKRPDEQHSLLADPWEFKGFVMRLNFRSALLQGYPNRPSTQREALLHLAFPDTFEAIVSADHKKRSPGRSRSSWQRQRRTLTANWSRFDLVLSPSTGAAITCSMSLTFASSGTPRRRTTATFGMG